MSEELTSFEVSKKLGIPYGRLREWIVRGHVKPSTQAHGQGSKAYFTKFDLYLIKLFDHLLKFGLYREEAAQRVNEMRHVAKISERDFFECVYVVLYRQNDGNSLTAFIPDQEFIMSLAGETVAGKKGMCDDALVINFLNIRQEVDSIFS
jgi:hypothetical protein